MSWQLCACEMYGYEVYDSACFVTGISDTMNSYFNVYFIFVLANRTSFTLRLCFLLRSIFSPSDGCWCSLLLTPVSI
jgi:hypothetical protein